MMEQLERLLLVASGAELSPENVVTHAWTTERTAQLGAVLQKMLRGCTEGAVSVTTGLVTSTSRFALQVRRAPWLCICIGFRAESAACLLLSRPSHA